MSNQKNMFISAHDILIKDEELLRLLYYPPANLVSENEKERLNPLDERLENILEMDSDILWEIRDKHLPLSSKSDDLEENAICRVYLYPGKIRPSFHNSLTIKQEIVADIFCHHRYGNDYRMMLITDRINKLLFNNRANGLGKIDYRNGYELGAPKGYEAYRHIYELGGVK